MQILQMEEPRLLGVAETAGKWVTTTEEEENGDFSEMHPFRTVS